MSWIIGIAIGSLIGLIVGEAIEDKKYKVGAGIILALVSGGVGTFIFDIPALGDSIGIGLLIGFIASIYYEPRMRRRSK